MERITRARVKDCFKDDETIYFVVGRGEMGKALGKGGSNIKKVQQEMGKKIKVIEYNDHLVTFVKNVIAPVEVEEITVEDNVVLIKDSRRKTKSLLIGRNGKNLNLIKRAVRRFFNAEVKIE
jgi:N utilization substance protein A